MKIIITFILLFSLNQLAFAEQVLQLEQKVKLEGTLKTESKFGPPNYGETPEQDKKLTIFVLNLDKKTKIQVNKETVETDQIQCVIDTDTKVTELIGKKVNVEGLLFEQSTGYHFTPVLIDISSIKQ